MRVLAADDDEQIRDVLARLLRRLGAEVELARCGEEALSLLSDSMRGSRGRFDAAFVDLSMPWSLRGRAAPAAPPSPRAAVGAGDSGGLALAAALRAEEARSRARPLRLVALSGADDARGPTARRGGFDVFLQKPVGLDALKRELDAAEAALADPGPGP
jgi:CheY-like chemotaxis protein